MTEELKQFTEICLRLRSFALANNLAHPEILLPRDWDMFVRYHDNSTLIRSMGANTVAGLKVHYSLSVLKETLKFYGDGLYDKGKRARAALNELTRQ